MNSVRVDYNDRVSEVNAYFDLLSEISLLEGVLLFPDGQQKQFSDDILKIFKANGFLILYNLAESSIKNCISEIYSSLKSSGVGFDELTDGIKKELISFLKNKISTDRFVANVTQLAYEIIEVCFSSEKLLSGNLDVRKVRELANKYGFSHNIMPMSEEDGTLVNIKFDSIKTIKRNRNDLAHGIYSFKDCGKDYTIQELVEIKKHLIAYLDQILDHIETFIQQEGYKRA